MKKALTIFSITVICLFTLSVFGWMSSHLTKEDKDFGFLNKPVKFMYTFLDSFAEAVEEVTTLPPTFLKTPADFQAINKLDEDLIVLTTYTDEKDNRTIALMNLRNDSVIHTWNLKNYYEAHDRIINPLLLPDKNLIYSFDGKGLRRIDAQGNFIWKQDSVWAHHSLNKGNDGSIWICSFAPVWSATAKYKLNGRTVFYKDNYITKLDAETGRILFHKSVTEILTENQLSQHLLKSPNILDPIHINDVQPALKTTSFYQKGDVFISARCTSFILHYRPSTNELIKLIEGPFANQHDVDFLDDNTLVFFNNNYYTLWSFDSKPVPPSTNKIENAGDFYSNIVAYDLRDESFTFIGDSIFRANQIMSHTEGLQEFIDPSTYFVEEQNKGFIWVIRDDEVIYKNVFKSQHDGYHHLPNWTRIIKNYD